jgi:hypothetical protein
MRKFVVGGQERMEGRGWNSLQLVERKIVGKKNAIFLLK